MATGSLATGIVFIALGLIALLFPRQVVAFRAYVAQKVFGAKVVPSQRTYLAYRILGAALSLVGAYMLWRAM